jgi:gluconate 5-dehydrogenase
MIRSAQSVLLTGTSSGLGRALLELYAAAGAKVICVNRRPLPELEARYPNVRFECIDVRSRERVTQLVRELAAASELPELFILNAGINRVDNDDSFRLDAYSEVLDTNLYGVLNFVQPLTELGRSEVPRHVVAVSSMASYVGNPYALGYHTSKRALSACFAAWSRMYAGTDLVFQRVMLGPIRTSMYTMGHAFPGWMVRIRNVFSAPVEESARAIARFAQTRRKTLFHAWHAVPLYLAMWLFQALAPSVFQGRKTAAGSARR